MLLQVVDLTTRFHVPDGVVHAAEGVDLEIGSGEVVAVVGESGSGKSVTALSAMRLIAEPPGRIVRGQVLFHGEDLLTKTRLEMQAIRGRRISMIFQNPYAALNPLINIGDQLRETLNRYRHVSRRQASDIIEESLARLGIAEPRRVLKSRPYQASGGMNQRVMLALALLGEPELLIADEPTTMLDAMTQMDIFQLMLKIQREMNMSIWLITHDFRRRRPDGRPGRRHVRRDARRIGRLRHHPSRPQASLHLGADRIGASYGIKEQTVDADSGRAPRPPSAPQGL